MRNYVALLALLSFYTAHAQTVYSSCEGDSLLYEKYRYNASTLTLRWVYENDHPSKDSLKISDEIRKRMYRPLFAVHNAITLDARDTIVEMLDVKAMDKHMLKIFCFKCRVDDYWTRDCQKTLNGPRNALFIVNDDYTAYLKAHGVERLHSEGDCTGSDGYAGCRCHYAAQDFLNLLQIKKTIDTSSFIWHDPLWWQFRQYIYDYPGDISIEFHTHYSDLTYYYKWTDISPKEHYWKFRVLKDCRVDYLGAFGDKLPDAVLDTLSDKEFALFPNPVSNILTISGIREDINYILRDATGRIVQEGVSSSRQIDFRHLVQGVYFLSVLNEPYGEVRKIIKY